MRKALLLLCLCLYIGAEDFKIKIGVSLAPYAYFVKKIGGDFVDVITLIPSKRNPKFYQLDYRQTKQIKDMRLLIISGVSYEKKWLHRFEATNPSLRILDLSPKACKQTACYDWLSFDEARDIARKIAHQLRVIDLKNAQNYKKNLEDFLRDIEKLKEKLVREIALPRSKKRVIDSNGVWRVLSKEMKLDYVSLQEAELKRGDFCFVTPFEVKKEITSRYKIPRANLVELNPYREDWQDLIEDFVNLVLSGGKHGE